MKRESCKFSKMHAFETCIMHDQQEGAEFCKNKKKEGAE